MISQKIISVLLFAGALTLWEVFFRQKYFDWILSQGGVVGTGEIFGGYVVVGAVTTLITWILLRRLRQAEVPR